MHIRPTQTRRKRARLTIPVLVVLVAVGIVSLLPFIIAAVLLHPLRWPVVGPPPQGCRTVAFEGLKVQLEGWHCGAVDARRGTVVYLHGVADNRSSGTGIIRRFRDRGFDVLAYDSRAHGNSGGDFCTYGFREKQDLRRALDTVEQGPIVLFGISLGAAVALQAAAEDPRVTAVIAAETFSDLRTVVAERAPFPIPSEVMAHAFKRVEERGGFGIDHVSPAAVAPQISAPVLLIHGEADLDTVPDHSRRGFAALRSPKRLMIVPNARHNGSLRADVWDEIDRWMDDVLNPAT